MPRRGLLSLLLCLLLLLPALGGGLGVGLAWQAAADEACPLTASAPAPPRGCPCQAAQAPEQNQAQASTANACHCPADAPCQVSKAPRTQAPEIALCQLEWPQAPGLAALSLPAAPWESQFRLASHPVPPAPPPEPLYLRNSSLLI